MPHVVPRVGVGGGGERETAWILMGLPLVLILKDLKCRGGQLMIAVEMITVRH